MYATPKQEGSRRDESEKMPSGVGRNDDDCATNLAFLEIMSWKHTEMEIRYRCTDDNARHDNVIQSFL